MYIDDNKLVKLTEPKTICFALTNNVVNNFKQKTESFINNYEFLVENRIETTLTNYWRTASMETIFKNTENNKMNEPHKFLLNLSQRLVLGSSSKHVTFQNLSNYYMRKNIRQQHKNNKNSNM